MREFIDNKDSYVDTVPDQLKELVRAVKTLPESTAECERGFSALDEVITSKRSKLLVKNVSSLLFLKINGLPLGSFNLTAFVRTWSVSGHREAMDTRSRSCNAAKFGRMTDSSKMCLWNIFDK